MSSFDSYLNQTKYSVCNDHRLIPLHLGYRVSLAFDIIACSAK
jgi:hypothetical protein